VVQGVGKMLRKAFKLNGFVLSARRLDGVLRGEKMSMTNLEGRYVKNTYNAKKAAAFESSWKTDRKDFLQKLGNDPEYTAALKSAGLSSKEIKDLKSGKTPEGYQVHHKVPRDYGGDNSFENLILMKDDPYHQLLTKYQNTLTNEGLAPKVGSYVPFPIPNGSVYVPGK